LLAVLLLAGCSAGLGPRWTDFNAYFNTYYNARVSYEKGHKQIREQQVTYNPARPIRAHLTPVRAGQADFERAIEKGANILRNYPESRWADDALELIGRSFFMLGQYFSAEIKFNEVLLASRDPLMRQRAILWRGLVFLETNRTKEGIDYLNAQITSEAYEWKPEILAEIRIVLAQLHIQVQDYQSAEPLLKSGLARIDDVDIQARARFLHGQLLRWLHEAEPAIDAFGRVNRNYRDYQLIYLAQIEIGRILRETGQYPQALRHFQAMTRDDKHFDQLADLNYEIAAVRLAMGETARAETELKDVLYRSLKPPSRVTQSFSHSNLGDIYRFHLVDYRLAAAHYDSSGRLANDPLLFPEDFNAAMLGRTFTDLARLTAESARLDSLLRLGVRPPAERDSLIAQLRVSRLARYEAERREQQRQGTTLIVAGAPSGTGAGSNDGASGFLNHKNPQLVEQSAQAFAAMWQNRPLVDHWRRMEVARNARVDETDATRPVAQSRVGVRTDLDATLGIQIADLPITAIQQQETRSRLATLTYEIGNVFYLTLALPDSASAYYREAVSRFPESPIAPQAYYSLADIALASSDSTAALRIATILATDHVLSPFHERLSERLGQGGMRRPVSVQADTNAVILEPFIIGIANLGPFEKAVELNRFAERYPAHPRSGDVLHAAAVSYAEAARATAGHSHGFQHALWDSTRQVLSRFRARYPQHRLVAMAVAMQAELDRTEETPSVDMVDCGEIDQPIAPRGGMEAFLDAIGFRKTMSGFGIQGADFEFEITLSETGSVLNLKPVTDPDEFGLLDTLTDRIASDLLFFPPTKGGIPVRTVCPLAVIVTP
jgi:tetratricopeptide (TPR) repeat protein